MRLFNLVLACCAALSVCSISAAPAAPLLPLPATALWRGTEPFAQAVEPLPEEHPLSARWRRVLREIDNEMLVIALCEESRAVCASPAAQTFAGIVGDGRAREGRARIGVINRALNLAIRPASDLAQYGEDDVWRAPLALLAQGAGDCEDYAIAKFVALRSAGIAASDLRLVILRDELRQEDHAVASVRLDGRWFLLDNRRMAMVEDAQLPHHRPLFLLDAQGARHYGDMAQRPGPA